MNKRLFSPFVIAAVFAAVLSVQTACAQPVPLSEVTFEDAITSFNYGDNDLANRQFKKLADGGDSRAQYYLAYMMDSGLGTAVDVAGAANWYRKSAQQDYLPAIVYMGYIYSAARGVSRDDKEAFKWYTRAAQMGDAIAQNNLATMLQRGIPYAKNEPLAAQWFMQSAMQGNMRAQYNLATMYRLGSGIKRNLPEAMRWYAFAANQGDMYAQNALGYMYRKGDGLGDTPDPQSAVDWYRRAAEQGHMKSQMAIAVMYELGEVPDKGANEAIDWYFQAAGQGNEKAMHRIAYLYERGPECVDPKAPCARPERKGDGLPKDDKAAFGWYKKSAEERNYPPSIVALASFYEQGKGVKADMRKAQELYQKAAGMNDPLAMMELARLFKDGKGTFGKPDQVRALMWYKLARAELARRIKSGSTNAAEDEMLTASINQITKMSLNMNLNDKENAERMFKAYRPLGLNMYNSQKKGGFEYDPNAPVDEDKEKK